MTDVGNSTDIKSVHEMSFMDFPVEYKCVIKDTYLS